jgi:hypothetical protein
VLDSVIHVDAASTAVTEMGGKVAKKLGDGLMALFGYPVAQENDAEPAVRAALSIQHALADLNRKNEGVGKPALNRPRSARCGRDRVLTLPPEELRGRQFGALIGWTIASARVQPLVLAFEDLHWADPTPWSIRSHHGTISDSPCTAGAVHTWVGSVENYPSATLEKSKCCNAAEPSLPRAARKEISIDMGRCGRLANDPARGAGRNAGRNIMTDFALAPHRRGFLGAATLGAVARDRDSPRRSGRGGGRPNRVRELARLDRRQAAAAVRRSRTERRLRADLVLGVSGHRPQRVRAPREGFGRRCRAPPQWPAARLH